LQNKHSTERPILNVKPDYECRPKYFATERSWLLKSGPASVTFARQLRRPLAIRLANTATECAPRSRARAQEQRRFPVTSSVGRTGPKGSAEASCATRTL